MSRSVNVRPSILTTSTSFLRRTSNTETGLFSLIHYKTEHHRVIDPRECRIRRYRAMIANSLDPPRPIAFVQPIRHGMISVDRQFLLKNELTVLDWIELDETRRDFHTNAPVKAEPEQPIQNVLHTLVSVSVSW